MRDEESVVKDLVVVEMDRWTEGMDLKVIM